MTQDKPSGGPREWTLEFKQTPHAGVLEVFVSGDSPNREREIKVIEKSAFDEVLEALAGMFDGEYFAVIYGFTRAREVLRKYGKIKVSDE